MAYQTRVKEREIERTKIRWINCLFIWLALWFIHSFNHQAFPKHPLCVRNCASPRAIPFQFNAGVQKPSPLAPFQILTTLKYLELFQGKNEYIASHIPQLQVLYLKKWSHQDLERWSWLAHDNRASKRENLNLEFWFEFHYAMHPQSKCFWNSRSNCFHF